MPLCLATLDRGLRQLHYSALLPSSLGSIKNARCGGYRTAEPSDSAFPAHPLAAPAQVPGRRGSAARKQSTRSPLTEMALFAQIYEMKQPIRCPAGVLYDGAVHPTCPCPSCWADRSSTRLVTSRANSSITDITPESEPVASNTPAYPSETARSPYLAGRQRGFFRAAFRLWFSFDGRITRSQFWGVVFANYLALAVVVVGFKSGAIALQAVATLFGTLLVLSGVAVSSKRLHDRDWTSLWLLLFYGVPALLMSLSAVRPMLPQLASMSHLGQVFATPLLCWGLIEIGCVRGTPDVNRFGHDPLKRTAQRQREKGLIRLLFSFDGRLNRVRFVLSVLAVSAFLVGWSFVGVVVQQRMVMSPPTIQLISVAVIGIVAIPCLVSLLASLIRRVQDINLNPSFLALLSIPWVLTAIWPMLKTPGALVDIFALVVLSCFPGSVGSNRYGQDRIARAQPTRSRQLATPDAALASDPAAATMVREPSPEARVKLSSLLRDVSTYGG
jgi:uncharacterized membrane protein YhaH (DUF805 family)